MFGLLGSGACVFHFVSMCACVFVFVFVFVFLFKENMLGPVLCDPEQCQPDPPISLTVIPNSPKWRGSGRPCGGACLVRPALPSISYTMIPKSPKWEGVWLNVRLGMIGGARPLWYRTVSPRPPPHFGDLDSEVPEMRGSG
jgi:hypothetical protein